MKLTRIQKVLGLVAVCMVAGACLTDGHTLALFLLLGGFALGVYVIHTLPKRPTKYTDF